MKRFKPTIFDVDISTTEFFKTDSEFFTPNGF